MWESDSFGDSLSLRREHMSAFSGKAVLVTGAGTGIGYALCQAFASAGATVALNDIDPTLCQRAAQQINETLGVERVHPYAGDVADVEAVRTMCQRFFDTAGRLDIAIANAGITNYGAFLTSTPEAFDRLTHPRTHHVAVFRDWHPGTPEPGGLRDHQGRHWDDGQNHRAASGLLWH